MPILDSSAVLALLFNEPGHEAVRAALPRSRISAVNLTEVIGVYNRGGASRRATERAIDRLNLVVDAHDEVLARETGFLETTTRRLGLSIGDRACLCLAAQLADHVLTADRAMAAVGGRMGLKVELIR